MKSKINIHPEQMTQINAGGSRPVFQKCQVTVISTPKQISLNQSPKLFIAIGL